MKENNIDISNEIKFVVKRNGYRVSTEEHDTYEDALDEHDYWQQIVNRWPDGSKISIESVSTNS